MFFFLKLLISNKTIKKSSQDKNTIKHQNNKTNIGVFIRWVLVVLVFSFFFQKSFLHYEAILGNHIRLNNFTIYLFFLINFINFVYMFFLKNVKRYNVNDIYNFFYSVSTIMLIFILPFTANTAFFFLYWLNWFQI